MKPVHVSQQERVYFHPVVKAWLQDRGYKALHEVGLGGLIPDFIAIRNDHTLIVECKLSVGIKKVDEYLWKISHYLFEYQRRNPGIKTYPVLAASFFAPGTVEICQEWRVGTLRLDYVVGMYALPFHSVLTKKQSTAQDD